VTKNQIAVLALLVMLVLAIFAVFAYLVFFAGNGDADSTPTATPAPIVAETATPADTPASGFQPAPTSTPSRAAAVVTGDVKTVARATMEVTAEQTVEAQARLDAAMQQMPVGEFDLAVEADGLIVTMKRIGWLRIGQLWLKVQFTNNTHEYLTIDPGYLRLIGQDGESYAVEASAAELPGALLPVAIEAGDSVTGDVSFRLPVNVPPAELVYDDGVRGPLKLDILSWIVSQPVSTSQ
jgi:hypothetical protein